MEREKRFTQGERAAWSGIVINFILVFVKASVGLWAGSQAMVADAIHSGADFIASFAVLVGLKTSRKPADECHPYGHGKAESVSAKIVSVLLIIAGVNVAWMTLKSIPEQITGNPPHVLALWVTAGVIISKEALFRYKINLARKIASPALEANAWEHRADAISSVAAFVGIVGARLGYPVLDPIAGFIVALFVIRIGYLLAKNAIEDFLDHALDKKTISLVQKTASSVPGVEHVTSVKGRHLGPDVLVDMTIEMEADLTIERAHAVTEEIQSAISAKVENVVDVFIHVEPHVSQKHASGR